VHGRLRQAGLTAVAALAASAAAAQDASPPSPAPVPAPVSAPAAAPSPAAPEPFHFWGEMKTNLRYSRFVQTSTFTPTGPGPFRFIPTGHQRTVDAGTALELQNASLIGEGDLGLGVSARLELHFLDLYNRNPTSTDDRFFVRQAWVRFGGKAEALQAVPESRLYVLAGVAPRFSKPAVRALESYGMWATAVGRFEMPQIQAGGALGGHAYWRVQVGKGNPFFLRDTNVLAGDNGTPVPASGPVPYENGFPIFYDAKMGELDTHGRLEWGAGLGFRRLRPPPASGLEVDALGWYFHRKLDDAVPLRGTSLLGDLDLLRGRGYPMPFEGNDKSEAGLNVSARRGRWRLDGQLVRQDVASLVRRGFDAEVACLFTLPGLFLVGETPFGNWIRPVIRVSIIDNLFDGPVTYPFLSVDWDWRKYDFGVRFGLVRDVDLTVEYSRHDMIVPRVGTLHPDEFLMTLRVGVRP
jgi:hypothetical protein